MITIKPDTRQGHFALLSPEGDPIGAGIARPSVSVPGYVSLVITHAPPGLELRAFRVPADWVAELAPLPNAEDAL